MPEINRPDDLAAELADMRRRLEALETGQRATKTSIRNGLLRILDTDGSAVVEVGKRSDGLVGLFVYSSSGLPMFAADNDGGVSTPVYPLSWLGNPAEPIDSNGRKTTTSATFSALWRTYKAFAFGDQFGYNFNFSVPSGTTGDWQLTAVEVGGSSPAVVASGTGLTNTVVNVAAIVTLPPSATISGTDAVLGRYFNFQLEMRRTAGAGVVAAMPIEQARIFP